MRLAVVSDTHDNHELVRVAAAWLEREDPDLVLHLGDVTTRRGIEPLRRLPIVVLRGNNDGPALDADLRALSIEPAKDEWVAELRGFRIGATHGHHRGAIERLASTCDLVLHGHSHRMRHERVEQALVVNPGALQRAARKTFCVIELVSVPSVRFYEVTPREVVPIAPPFDEARGLTERGRKDMRA